MARKFAKQVGALWRHHNEKVGQFLTGILDLGGLGEVPIAIFKNDRKEENSKQPDYRIVLSGKMPGGKLTEGGGEGFAPGDDTPF